MKIRAAVLERFGEPLAVQDVELAGPAAGEVLVRLAACGMFEATRLVGVMRQAVESARMGWGTCCVTFQLMHHQNGIRSVITDS